jgi:membrane protein
MRKVSGILGTVVLVLFATPLCGACRLVTHRLLGVRGRGSWVRNFLRDAGMVLLLGVLLFGLSAATWIVYWVQFVVMPSAHMPAPWIHAFALAASAALSAAMFYLAYRYVPRRPMRPRAAIAGALLASVLWEVAKQLFRVYIHQVGVYDQIYGPLGVLVAFVMFVYYSAIVFVFAAAYAATVETRRN